MKKIKTLFAIDRRSHLATEQVVPESAWVLQGTGLATEKFDGSACLFREGRLWKRYDRKLRKPFAAKLRAGRLATLDHAMFKSAPDGFAPCEAEPDAITGHWPGWLPVSEASPEDRWHCEALEQTAGALIEGQTYELVGPKVQGNRYQLQRHALWAHGGKILTPPERLDFHSLRDWMAAQNMEGVVWHAPDGRMAKLRRKDFGFSW
ncbi:DUF5565 family protein [Hahella sp. HN01]|uniref:RNA ligase 1 family protein n=1 Tax=Hahella sp. HN01 TaxID=2847262 RepID=UPI001C1EB0AC|nr:DUF5565 family protein [Hahella sp. HN01]MBU6953876.1 hypothetical protein [Hahella sp. HN01]